MDGVIDHNPKAHREDHRKCETDLADKQPPKAEGHAGRDEVGDEADQSQLQAPEGEDHAPGDEHDTEKTPVDHADDVSLAEIGKHEGRPGSLYRRRFGVVSTEPLLCGLLQRENFLGGQIFCGDDQSGRRFVDVDPVVHVEAKRQREFVEQKILRRQRPVVGNPVPRRVVPVHIFV